MDGGGDLLTHRLGGQGRGRHADQVLQAGERFARPVGVDGTQRAVVAGVHRLQHVQRLGAADLTKDDAVGSHTQRVLDEIAHGDLALAFEVGRARLQAHDMRLLQLQLGRVLDGTDAFAFVDRRLARAGTARNQDVETRARSDLEHNRHLGGDAAALGHRVERDGLLGKLTNRDGGAVDGERRGDDVDAAAVGQARVDQRRRFINAPADLRDDAGRDAHHVGVVAEGDVGELQLAATLDIDLAAITQAGGWKSTRMPLQYAEKINAARSGMARAAAAGGRDEPVSK